MLQVRVSRAIHVGCAPSFVEFHYRMGSWRCSKHSSAEERRLRTNAVVATCASLFDVHLLSVKPHSVARRRVLECSGFPFNIKLSTWNISIRTRLFILVVHINDDKITYEKLELSGLNCPHLKWSNWWHLLRLICQWQFESLAPLRHIHLRIRWVPDY